MGMIIGFAIWYIIGVAGFIYWWTKDYDLHMPEIILAFVIGLVGPASWIFGWFVHGDTT